jgi:competence protein ComEC
MRYPFAKFPFLRYCLVYILGIVLATNWPKIDENIPKYLLATATGLYILLFWKNIASYRNLQGLLGLFVLLILGYYLTCQKLNTLTLDVKQFAKIDQYFTANISSLAEEKQNFWKARATIEHGNTEILLYLSKKHFAKPQYGHSYYIKAKLNPLDPPKNPSEFDYRQYLHYQGVHYQAFVFNNTAALTGLKPASMLYHKAYWLNNYCNTILARYLKNEQNLAVTKAMILGLRDEIDPELLQAYSAAGAIHVLSVSGLHVGVIVLVLAWLLGFLKKRSSWEKGLYVVIILAILWGYALLTGMSAPVLRCTVMFSVILLGDTFGKQKNTLNTLAISAFFILLVSPLQLMTVGFMLSYLAVLGMVLIQPLLKQMLFINKKKSVVHWLAGSFWELSTVALAAQLATLPVIIYFFHQFPNYFLLANVAVIVLSSVALVLGLVFMAMVPLFESLAWLQPIKALAWLLEHTIALLNQAVKITERLPGAISNFLHINLAELLLQYGLIACVLLVFAKKKYIWVQTASVVLVCLIFLNIKDLFMAKNYQAAYIHAIPKAVAITHTCSSRSVLYASSNLLAEKLAINYRLNSYWAQHGITDTTMVLLPGSNKLLSIADKKILILQQKLLKMSEPIHTDYLLVNNKKLSYSKDIEAAIVAKYILLGGSFTEYYTNKFVAEARSRGKAVYVLQQHGALQIW